MHRLNNNLGVGLTTTDMKKTKSEKLESGIKEERKEKKNTLYCKISLFWELEQLLCKVLLAPNINKDMK